ncbi:MAG: hypothetical protein H0W64_12015 [Gammaproteobacteria bacterium]|nr:hypothetical protein [Gammaproteobacteria bacterium]
MVDNKGNFKDFLLDEPEAALQRGPFSYQDNEIQSLIDKFYLSKTPSLMTSHIIQLLTATQHLRYATTPFATFVKMRADKTPAERNAIFAEFHRHFKAARTWADKPELTVKEKEIMAAALQYAKQSLLQGIQELDLNDPLRIAWDESELRRDL